MGKFWNGDCLELMAAIPDGSIDMILCDLPYGTTACSWDAIIPFEPLWAHYWRVAKPNAAIVLTAAQPFTTTLITSQIEYFKYDWAWVKSRKMGQLNAKNRPLVGHESVLIFYKKQPFYTPYKDEINPLGGTKATPTKTQNYRAIDGQEVYRRPENITKNSVLSGFDVGTERGLHPTQKPVALFEYLIKTYTSPGALILDNCSGSGTTAIAAHNTGRNSICIEKDEDYYWKSVARAIDAGVTIEW